MPGFGLDPFFGGFAVFGIIFTIISTPVIGLIIFFAVRGLSTWNRNNNSPKITVPAKVVTKRSYVSRHHGAGDIHHTSTTYYVTFQVQSGDRMELHVSGQEYGLLAEGDFGSLTYQGTRYLGFVRSEIST